TGPGRGTLNTIAVTLTIGAQKTLTAAPPSLTFGYTLGGSAPASQTVSVNNNPAGATAVNAAVTTGGTWLSVSPAGGSTPAVFTASINTAGLTTTGTLNGNIQITSTGLTPVNVPVSINVGSSTLTVP